MHKVRMILSSQDITTFKVARTELQQFITFCIQRKSQNLVKKPIITFMSSIKMLLTQQK